jgi:hypothetical protein
MKKTDKREQNTMDATGRPLERVLRNILGALPAAAKPSFIHVNGQMRPTTKVLTQSTGAGVQVT